ncbi:MULTISPECIES: hypothetical protein [unclassified Hyphomonas]|uniref:hypothetical protein n=1 Tax=unclassified Hyphomonas TaxID=2630699 RepID=UPI000AEAF050|nr:MULTISPECIES: hypothetical protein [unclassified Hyphomonas]
MDSNTSSPAVSPSIPDLIAQAWRLAAQAALPSLPWLALLALMGGFYKWALNTGAGGTMLTLAALVVLFLSGVQASLMIYRAMIPEAKGAFMALMHMNLAVYLAFFFISFFIFFFVGIFGVVMLQLSGLVDLAAEGADEQIPAALAGMMSMPYGWALSAVYATGLGGLAFLALRLLLAGAATVQTGRVMVFRTWRWTKGDVLRLGAASLATHVLPFLAGYVANLVIVGAAGQGEVATFATGVTGLFLQAPFILAGHGLAVAALRAAHPPANVA